MNVLAPAIPILTFLIWWGVFYETQRDWRTSFLSASVVWGVFIVAITEILGVFKEITFGAMAAGWSLFFCIGFVWLAKRRIRLTGLLRGIDLFDSPWAESLLLLGAVLIWLAIGVIAWVAPPNTWDSMTYHMPRVMHWIQNRSVDYYPTHTLRQLYLNPGGEFIVLQFQILSGSDRLANLVQWFSMIGSAIGVSLIAERLGVSPRGQSFSAIVSMTIPMGILQASSTQTDYVTAYWLVCFVFWMLLLMARPRVWYAAAWGASLGLAALSKATTYVYALPFLIGAGLWILKSYRWRAVQLAGIAALIFTTINLGYYVRNEGLFANPLAMSPDNPHHFANDVFSVPELASNVVRNLSLNLGTPFNHVNVYLDRGVGWFHRAIGISESDPRTTWPGTKFMAVFRISLNEDTDGNLLHLILAVMSLLLLLRRPRTERKLLAYSVGLLAGFLVFCLYLKWQPWNSRLLLPLFVMYAPVIGTAADDIRPGWVGRAVMVMLLLGSLPWVLLNRSRPLLGGQSILLSDRTNLYFRNQPDLAGSYQDATRFLAWYSKGQCKQVGLYLKEDDWEYPFWVLLAQQMGTDVQLESVHTDNVSQKTLREFPRFSPCAVLKAGNAPIESLTIQARLYETVHSADDVSLLVPR